VTARSRVSRPSTGSAYIASHFGHPDVWRVNTNIARGTVMRSVKAQALGRVAHPCHVPKPQWSAKWDFGRSANPPDNSQQSHQSGKITTGTPAFGMFFFNMRHAARFSKGTRARSPSVPHFPRVSVYFCFHTPPSKLEWEFALRENDFCRRLYVIVASWDFAIIYLLAL